MENTSQNKGRFFAQYFGQEVQRWHQLDKETTNSVVHMLSQMSSGLCSVDKGWFLELTPLSLISDEDLIHCLEIMGKKFLPKYDDIKELRETFIEGFVNSEFYGTFYPYSVDYLRSKAYALPFMGLSVEQQIEYGWIKLKSVQPSISQQ